MDEARKKLRICLIFVVVVAVIIGMIYCFSDRKDKNSVNEGTLVRQIEPGELHGKGNLTGR